jgi:PEP-CTERM motif
MRRDCTFKLLLLCCLSFPMFLSANPLVLGLPESTAAVQRAIGSSNGYQYPIQGIELEAAAGQSIAEIDFNVQVAGQSKTLVAIVPEPSTSLLIGLGLLSVTYIGRRLRRRG